MKKLGPLEKGIVFQPTSNGLIARAVSDVAKSTTIENKFKLLFAKFNVEEGNWQHLALVFRRAKNFEGKVSNRYVAD